MKVEGGAWPQGASRKQRAQRAQRAPMAAVARVTRAAITSGINCS